ncbi:MAG TPA: hypothetical protein VJ861_05355 [Treponemataceae bacterium]|nr:hypothetical protein [Treponemataceae bacterium]
MVYAHKAQYYQAINDSTAMNNSGLFVEFLLESILEALKQHSAVTPEVAPEVTPEVKRLLDLFYSGEPLSRKELQVRIGLADEKNFRQKYLLPALVAGYIEMTIPEKPQSSLQKYRRVR